MGCSHPSGSFTRCQARAVLQSAILGRQCSSAGERGRVQVTVNGLDGCGDRRCRQSAGRVQLRLPREINCFVKIELCHTTSAPLPSAPPETPPPTERIMASYPHRSVTGWIRLRSTRSRNKSCPGTRRRQPQTSSSVSGTNVANGK